MVEFLHVRKWEKGNRTNFYWIMLLMYTILEYLDILTLETFCEYLVILLLDIVQKSFWISSHLEIVQIFFLYDVFVPEYIFKTI